MDLVITNSEKLKTYKKNIQNMILMILKIICCFLRFFFVFIIIIIFFHSNSTDFFIFHGIDIEFIEGI